MGSYHHFTLPVMKRANEGESANKSKRARYVRFTVTGETLDADGDDSCDEEVSELYPLVPLPVPRLVNWERNLSAGPCRRIRTIGAFMIRSRAWLT